MGEVIAFPELLPVSIERRPEPTEPAVVIFLPTVKVERIQDVMPAPKPTILVLDPVEFLKP